jgi:hypothetical protein
MQMYQATSIQTESILEQTSASTDFRSLVDVIDAGPRTRGVERKIYPFKDGTSGDVYRCVLKAVASNPPRLSFSYVLPRTASDGHRRTLLDGHRVMRGADHAAMPIAA